MSERIYYCSTCKRKLLIRDKTATYAEPHQFPPESWWNCRECSEAVRRRYRWSAKRGGES